MEELLQILGDGFFVYWVYKMREEVALKSGVIVRLRVLLVLALRPCGGVIFETDCNFKDPETLV